MDELTPQQNAAISRLRAVLRESSDETRLVIFWQIMAGYCEWCGRFLRTDRRCQCQMTSAEIDDYGISGGEQQVNQFERST